MLGSIGTSDGKIFTNEGLSMLKWRMLSLRISHRIHSINVRFQRISNFSQSIHSITKPTIDFNLKHAEKIQRNANSITYLRKQAAAFKQMDFLVVDKWKYFYEIDGQIQRRHSDGKTESVVNLNLLSKYYHEERDGAPKTRRPPIHKPVERRSSAVLPSLRVLKMKVSDCNQLVALDVELTGTKQGSHKRLLLMKNMKSLHLVEVHLNRECGGEMAVSNFEFGLVSGSRKALVVVGTADAKDLDRPNAVFCAYLDDMHHSKHSVLRVDDHRPVKLPLKAELLLHEPDPKFFIDIFKARDQSCIFVSLQSKSSSEVWMFPSASHASMSPTVTPATRLVKCVSRQDNYQRFVDCCGRYFLLSEKVVDMSSRFNVEGVARTLRPHNNLRMYLIPKTAETPLQTAASPNEVMASIFPMMSEANVAMMEGQRQGHNDEVTVEDYELFMDAVVVFGRKAGCPRVWRVVLLQREIERSSSSTSSVGWEELDIIGALRKCSAEAAAHGTNRDEEIEALVRAYLNGAVSFSAASGSTGHDQVARFIMSSNAFVGDVEFELDFRTGTVSVVPPPPQITYSTRRQILAQTSRRLLRSHDGCEVPLLLLEPVVSTVSPPPQGPRPLLLLAYGAYGISYPLHAQEELQYLLKLGWTIAIAQVRGGGEMGQRWQNMGAGVHKMNSMLDFKACAQHLIDSGITDAAHLCARVESAGGLIGGFAINEFPELFRCIVMRSPFVDIYDTMTRHNAAPPHLLTEHEVDEWGDPAAHPAINHVMKSYCPLTNSVAHAPSTEKSKSELRVWISISQEDQLVNAASVLRFAENIRHRLHGRIDDDNSGASGKRKHDDKRGGRVMVDMHEGGHLGPDTEPKEITHLAREITFFQHAIQSRE